MIAVFHRIATPDDEGERLDRFVRRHAAGVDPAGLREAIDAGRVTINSRRAAKGAKLRPGDAVDGANLPEPGDRRPLPDPSIPLEIIRAEPSWIACSKPAAMPTHPLRPGETGTLANAIVARWPEVASFGDPIAMGGILHRLDTDTSGVVLAARNPDVYGILRAQFAARSVLKTYLALVSGGVPESGRLENGLVHASVRPCRMTDASLHSGDEKPMRAVTEFEVVSRHAGMALLEVRIRTGVTHQIRCQLSLAGFPIVGDALYGGVAAPGLGRHFLHASAIEFSDPITGAPVKVESPIPGDLCAFLSGLSS